MVVCLYVHSGGFSETFGHDFPETYLEMISMSSCHKT